MNIHVQIAHPKLFSRRKQQFKEMVVKLGTHILKLKNKRTSPSYYAITNFFGPTNPYPKNDDV
jgi:hypothetical protein